MNRMYVTQLPLSKQRVVQGRRNCSFHAGRFQRHYCVEVWSQLHAEVAVTPYNGSAEPFGFFFPATRLLQQFPTVNLGIARTSVS
jgi:hypothetical protein